MASPKKMTHENTRAQLNENGTVEVLYQKMGNRWFAFSLIDDEVFVGSISQDELEKAEQSSFRNDPGKLHRVSGNS